MKQKKYIWTMALAVGMTAVVSCSDFDDYNETPSEGLNVSADKTLWENIESNEQLSNFAQLAKRVGFDKNLQSTRYYTVWAPLNSALGLSQYEDMDSTTLMQEFVENHIAEYNHAASGDVNERIRTLNNKAYDFKGSGSTYSFGNIAIATANIPSTNGVIHTLNGVSEFRPNAYEYVMEQGTGIDSLRKYLQRYENTYLDESKSVIGPIVNGKQTYIDSVMVTENNMLRELKVEMEDEDSSYTLLLPTDTAWIMSYEAKKAKFKYIDALLVQDLESTSNDGNGASNDTKITTKAALKINAAYYTDSLAKLQTVRNIAFSNTNLYNARLSDGTLGFTETDTLFSTTSEKISNPVEVLARRNASVNLSNGKAYLLDSMAMYSWDTFAPTLEISARRNKARVLKGTSHNYSLTVHDAEGESESYEYVWVDPSSSVASPELDVYLPNVQSIAYHFYCVVAPGYDSNADTLSTRSNKLRFTLSYCNQSGKVASYVFPDGKTGVDYENTPNKKNEKDMLIPDTLDLGTFTFPVCYYGLGQVYSPNLKIWSKLKLTDKTTERALRIMGVILKPVEQENHEATKE